MKTIEINAYEYSELSDKAKLKALIDYQSDCEYDWSYDAVKSLKAFMNAVGVTMVNYNIDWLEPNRSRVQYYGKPTTKFIKEELTGYCADIALSKTFNKTKSIEDAVFAFFKDCADDYEYQLSEDGFIEYCERNEITFDEYGNQLNY
jgi:hypothetical protein